MSVVSNRLSVTVDHNRLVDPKACNLIENELFLQTILISSEFSDWENDSVC